MPSPSRIAWTDTTWSPVTGCAKVSAGCKYCYAEREVDSRWSHNPKSVFHGRAFTDVRCHDERLEDPLHWRTPKKIFVCPRGDLFHESVPDAFLDQVFAVMAMAPQHTFQVLTKRPERMWRFFNRSYRLLDWWHANVGAVAAGNGLANPLARRAAASERDAWPSFALPLPNVWLGVSVEDQEAANERIPLLLQTPAVVRWISAGPLLGPVDLSVEYLSLLCGGGYPFKCLPSEHRTRLIDLLDWVVVEGESGSHARPMHPQWARVLRDQCHEADVPFLFKQWGEWEFTAAVSGGDLGHDIRECVVALVSADGRENDGHVHPGDVFMRRVGVKRAGRLLDGELHEAFPSNTRQFGGTLS